MQRIPLLLTGMFLVFTAAAGAGEAPGGGVYLTLRDLQPVPAARPEQADSAAEAGGTPQSAPRPDAVSPPAPSPGEFETEQATVPEPPPADPLSPPDDGEPPAYDFPEARDDYRDGPSFYFGVEADIDPDIPLEPYYFNHSDTPRYDPRHSWDRWRGYTRRRLRESGPRPQYGVSRPSDPVRRGAPNRRFEWRDRRGGQNVRRPRER